MGIAAMMGLELIKLSPRFVDEGRKAYESAPDRQLSWTLRAPFYVDITHRTGFKVWAGHRVFYTSQPPTEF